MRARGQGVGILIFNQRQGGMGGCQTSGAESFPRTKREVFGCIKIHLFEFGVK